MFLLTVFSALMLCGCAVSLELKQRQALLIDGISNPPEIAWGTNSTHIELQMSYPSLGWIALGLSPDGEMDKSDVLFGYVDDRTRELVVQDRFIMVDEKFEVNPTLDASQDWISLSGAQNATHTTLRAVRKLRTTDSFDRPFPDTATPVIYAYNNKDPVSKTAQIIMHNQRGSTKISFLNGAHAAPATPAQHR